MYLVTNDKKRTIDVLEEKSNRRIATYYYESDLEYSFGLDTLLFLFVDS